MCFIYTSDLSFVGILCERDPRPSVNYLSKLLAIILTVPLKLNRTSYHSRLPQTLTSRLDSNHTSQVSLTSYLPRLPLLHDFVCSTISFSRLFYSNLPLLSSLIYPHFHGVDHMMWPRSLSDYLSVLLAITLNSRLSLSLTSLHYITSSNSSPLPSTETEPYFSTSPGLLSCQHFFPSYDFSPRFL